MSVGLIGLPTKWSANNKLTSTASDKIQSTGRLMGSSTNIKWKFNSEGFERYLETVIYSRSPGVLFSQLWDLESMDLHSVSQPVSSCFCSLRSHFLFVPTSCRKGLDKWPCNVWQTLQDFTPLTFVYITVRCVLLGLYRGAGGACGVV